MMSLYFECFSLTNTLAYFAVITRSRMSKLYKYHML
jgi:hypothetical protein